MPAAADDEKSLAWMASQAVKALNAVKASQMEQAQALKASGEISGVEQAPGRDEEGISLAVAAPADASPEAQLAAIRALNSEELSADAAALAIQSGLAAVAPLPASTPPAQAAAAGQSGSAPVTLDSGTPPPRIPSVSRGTMSRLPGRALIMFGVLVMFGYAGYRHWFAGDRSPGDLPATPSAVMEPAGPAGGVAMTPPAISVVAAPEPAAQGAAPASLETESALRSAPAIGAPPAVSREHTETASPATRAQEETVSGDTAQQVPVSPETAMQPEVWRPATVPVEPAPPVGAVETNAAVNQTPPPAPTAETAAAVTQTPPPAHTAETAAAVTQAPPPAPAADTAAPARQPAPTVPAARPRYPANGYGYYAPPSNWQPYYRPGYPQTPAHQ